LLQCNFPSSFKEKEYNLKLEYVLTQTFSISIVRQGEGELELREYVEKRFSFSVGFFFVNGGENLDMHRPKHIFFSMVGGVGTFFHCSVGDENLSIRGYIETFGGVGTSLYMDRTIYFFNCSVEWELRYVWIQPFSFSTVW
jgi:hypothetical protein